MGFLVRLLAASMIASLVTLSVLVSKRAAPFQPGSFASSVLGLDGAYVSSSTAAASTASTTAPTTLAPSASAATLFAPASAATSSTLSTTSVGTLGGAGGVHVS